MDDNDWKRLPSGRLYNHKFGYGKLDAYAIVEKAKTHVLVNQQTWLEEDKVALISCVVVLLMILDELNLVTLFGVGLEGVLSDTEVFVVVVVIGNSCSSSL